MELHGFTDKSTFREEFLDVYDPSRNHLGPDGNFPGVAALECSTIPVFDVDFETETPFGNKASGLDETHFTKTPVDEAYKSIHKLRGSPSFWWEYDNFEDWAADHASDKDDGRIDDVHSAIESDVTPVYVVSSRELYDHIWFHMKGHDVRTKILPPLTIHDVTLGETNELPESRRSYRELYRGASDYHLLNHQTEAEQ